MKGVFNEISKLISLEDSFILKTNVKNLIKNLIVFEGELEIIRKHFISSNLENIKVLFAFQSQGYEETKCFVFENDLVIVEKVDFKEKKYQFPLIKKEKGIFEKINEIFENGLKKIKEVVEMEIKIVNLTPHDIKVIKKDGSILEFKSEGSIRVIEEVEVLGEIAGIKVIKKRYSKVSDNEIEKLKEILKDENTIVIVSLLAGRYLRTDERLTEEEKKKIYFLSNTVRDEQGKVIGADAITNILDI